MSNTPVLGITQLEDNTNNKFTIHNQALKELEVYGNGSIIDAIATPPVSPTLGDFYLIYGTGSGDWLGQDNNLTVYNGTGWTFYPAVTGVRVKDLSTGRELYFDGTTWLVSGGERRPTYTTGADVTLSPLDSFLQVVDPNGAARNVVLPDPPDSNSDFAIVNDSDNLSASGNTVNVRETSGGTIIQVLDDTTGVASINATYVDSESKWILW